MISVLFLYLALSTDLNSFWKEIQQTLNYTDAWAIPFETQNRNEHQMYTEIKHDLLGHFGSHFLHVHLLCFSVSSPLVFPERYLILHLLYNSLGIIYYLFILAYI